MTIPAQPARVGMNPTSGDEVNVNVGALLRQFVILKENVGHYQAWLAGVNLVELYSMDPDLEASLKAAINTLDTDLDAIDMTFINRLVGIW